MTNNIHIFILAALTLSAIFIVIFSLRIRNKNSRNYLPQFEEIEDILAPSSKEEVVVSTAWKQKEADPCEKYADETLKDLGFGSLKDMFTPISSDEAHLPTTIIEPTFAEKKSSVQDLIVIHVMAKGDQQFMGYELLQALLGVGFRYGEMCIFHCYQDAESGGKKLFSLASATEPGIFDMNKMGIFVCKGLSIFMQIKGVEHSTSALELMLMTAQQLAEDLDGLLLDEKHQPLTEEIIARFEMQINLKQEKLRKMGVC